MLECLDQPPSCDETDQDSENAWCRRIAHVCISLSRTSLQAGSTSEFLRRSADSLRETLQLSAAVIWVKQPPGGEFQTAAVSGNERILQDLLARDPDPAGVSDGAGFVSRLRRHWKQGSAGRSRSGGIVMTAAPIEDEADCLGVLALYAESVEPYRLEIAAETAARELGLLLEPVRRSAADREVARLAEATLRFAPLAVVRADTAGRCTLWSPAAASLFGWPQPDVVGRTVPIAAPVAREEFWGRFRQAINARAPAKIALRAQRWDGSPLRVDCDLVPMLNARQEVAEVLMLITDQTHACALEQQLRLELDASSILARAEGFDAARPQVCSLIGRRLECRAVEFWDRTADERAWRLTGVWRRDAQEADASTLRRPLEDETLSFVADAREFVLLNGTIPQNAARGPAAISAPHNIEPACGVPILIRDEVAAVLIVRDSANAGPVSAQRQTLTSLAERIGEAMARDRMSALLRQSEESLRQNRKMEAIGMLAGGIAHDFNNLLTVVLGNCELLLESDRIDATTREFLEEVQTAEMKGASLTRQLLMFSRKRAPMPSLLDLRRLIRDSSRMLQRVVGEHVTIDTQVATETYHVHMDAVEFEQILLNLCVNARDAMPDGGTVSIGTANVALRARDVTHHAGVQPGEFVSLSVSDEGCGMDEQTKARIFEPFFTTKEPDKGTGMGLATVYGIVQRSRGFIDVVSRPSRGTCFTIYLPRAAMGIAPRQISDQPAEDPRGTETILVVEDEEVLRNLYGRNSQRRSGSTRIAGAAAARSRTGPDRHRHARTQRHRTRQAVAGRRTEPARAADVGVSRSD